MNNLTSILNNKAMGVSKELPDHDDLLKSKLKMPEGKLSFSGSAKEDKIWKAVKPGSMSSGEFFKPMKLHSSSTDMLKGNMLGFSGNGMGGFKGNMLGNTNMSSKIGMMGAGSSNANAKINQMLGNTNMSSKIGMMGVGNANAKISQMLGNNHAHVNMSNMLGASNNHAHSKMNMMGVSNINLNAKMSSMLGNKKFNGRIDMIGSSHTIMLKNNKLVPTPKFNNITSGFRNKEAALWNMVKVNPESVARKNVGSNRGLSMFGDDDKDGVMNVFDCEPRNKKRQGNEDDPVALMGMETYDEDYPVLDAPSQSSSPDAEAPITLLETYGSLSKPIRSVKLKTYNVKGRDNNNPFEPVFKDIGTMVVDKRVSQSFNNPEMESKYRASMKESGYTESQANAEINKMKSGNYDQVLDTTGGMLDTLTEATQKVGAGLTNVYNNSKKVIQSPTVSKTGTKLKNIGYNTLQVIAGNEQNLVGLDEQSILKKKLEEQELRRQMVRESQKAAFEQMNKQKVMQMYIQQLGKSLNPQTPQGLVRQNIATYQQVAQQQQRQALPGYDASKVNMLTGGGMQGGFVGSVYGLSSRSDPNSKANLLLGNRTGQDAPTPQLNTRVVSSMYQPQQYTVQSGPQYPPRQNPQYSPYTKKVTGYVRGPYNKQPRPVQYPQQQ